MKAVSWQGNDERKPGCQARGPGGSGLSADSAPLLTGPADLCAGQHASLWASLGRVVSGPRGLSSFSALHG